MIAIDYPPYQPKLKEQANGRLIFDSVRKQWVALTPEEWVRQHFIQYLVQVKNYPSSVLAIEKEINLWGLKKRCDIVVYHGLQPKLLVECKEPAVPLDNKVISQILRYNAQLQVPYLVITNGEYTAAFVRQGQDFVSISALPDWGELVNS